MDTETMGEEIDPVDLLEQAKQAGIRVRLDHGAYVEILIRPSRPQARLMRVLKSNRPALREELLRRKFLGPDYTPPKVDPWRSTGSMVTDYWTGQQHWQPDTDASQDVERRQASHRTTSVTMEDANGTPYTVTAERAPTPEEVARNLRRKRLEEEHRAEEASLLRQGIANLEEELETARRGGTQAWIAAVEERLERERKKLELYQGGSPSC